MHDGGDVNHFKDFHWGGEAYLIRKNKQKTSFIPPLK